MLSNGVLTDLMTLVVTDKDNFGLSGTWTRTSLTTCSGHNTLCPHDINDRNDISFWIRRFVPFMFCDGSLQLNKVPHNEIIPVILIHILTFKYCLQSHIMFGIDEAPWQPSYRFWLLMLCILNYNNCRSSSLAGRIPLDWHLHWLSVKLLCLLSKVSFIQMTLGTAFGLSNTDIRASRHCLLVSCLSWLNSVIHPWYIDTEPLV